MINKYTAYALVLLIVGMTGSCISLKSRVDSFDENRTPASIGEYKVEGLSNKMALSKVWTLTKPLSECGLSNADFVKYAMSKIDRKRQFQFIIFIDGKPLVGERCLKKAFIFYLR